MTTLTNRLTWMLAALAAIIWTNSALAGPRGNRQISEERRAKLLEKYADEGIDADGDGVLSDDEIKAFREEHRQDQADRPNRGRKGPGDRAGRRDFAPFGRSGDTAGPMVGMALARLEVLAQPTPPEGFSLERFPEADADDDGMLSNEEWITFAGEARTKLIARLDNAIDTLDADDDGAVSDEELAALRAEHVAKVGEHVIARDPEADADGDGVLSVEEWQAHVLAFEPGDFPGPGHRGPGHKGPGHRGPGHRGPNGPHGFDRDGNQKPKGPEL